MVTIAVTGGASGLGYECARQLAFVSEVAKVVITARSKDKAEQAVSKLVKDTGKDKSFFEFVILDLGDLHSINAAIVSFPAFDRLCMNAGGMGSGKMHVSGNGITDSMVINTMGHAMLVDGLFAAGKIPEGSRLVYVSSEVTRAMWSFFPMLPNYCGVFREKDIDWAIGKNYDGCGSCFPVRRQMGDYKNAKIIGQMHFAHLAKEHPDIHLMSVSPGAVGGQALKAGHFPIDQIGACCPCILFCMCVTPACSPIANTKLGAKRYVDVLTGQPRWDTGAMPMSGKCCPCCPAGSPCGFWGGRGPMVDNRPLVAYFEDEALCEKTSVKVREWVSKWANNAPEQMQMTMASHK
jgi:NAD(P)-dependent dehydrogenase (short-subunit alcohol dehydrogenase family)